MSSPQHEPTMEEILASIRKIISEDAPSGGETPAAPAQAPYIEPVKAETAKFESVKPEAAKTEFPKPELPRPELDVLELTQEIVDPPVPYKADNDVVFEAEEPTPAAPAASHDGIFSDRTRKALDDTFASIPDETDEPTPAPRAAAPFAPTDGASVETVFERAVRESFTPVLQKYLADNSTTVIEGMKPLIRDWMDEHFPPLLEGAVRAEVERVVKARGAKR